MSKGEVVYNAKVEAARTGNAARLHLESLLRRAQYLAYSAAVGEGSDQRAHIDELVRVAGLAQQALTEATP